MDLRNRTNRWIKAAGGKIGKVVSKVRSIGGRPGGEAVRSDTMLAEHYRTNAANVVRYLLKGASLTRYGEAGRIIGKRWGSTVNLRPAARSQMPFSAVLK